MGCFYTNMGRKLNISLSQDYCRILIEILQIVRVPEAHQIGASQFPEKTHVGNKQVISFQFCLEALYLVLKICLKDLKFVEVSQALLTDADQLLKKMLLNSNGPFLPILNFRSNLVRLCLKNFFAGC